MKKRIEDKERNYFFSQLEILKNSVVEKIKEDPEFTQRFLDCWEKHIVVLFDDQRLVPPPGKFEEKFFCEFENKLLDCIKSPILSDFRSDEEQIASVLDLKTDLWLLCNKYWREYSHIDQQEASSPIKKISTATQLTVLSYL